jgi:hypothetical protein
MNYRTPAQAPGRDWRGALSGAAARSLFAHANHLQLAMDDLQNEYIVRLLNRKIQEERDKFSHLLSITHPTDDISYVLGWREDELFILRRSEHNPDDLEVHDMRHFGAALDGLAARVLDRGGFDVWHVGEEFQDLAAELDDPMSALILMGKSDRRKSPEPAKS